MEYDRGGDRSEGEPSGSATDVKQAADSKVVGSTMDGARPEVADESGFVEVPYEVFVALPKTDLHVHLDGSLHPGARPLHVPDTMSLRTSVRCRGLY